MKILKVNSYSIRNLVAFFFFAFVCLVMNIAGEEEIGKSLSAFPILMYDTDIGYGYGAKAKFVNYLSRKESFDLILFNSSKGERWYVFTFSIPDFEIRQRKKYSFSFDLKAEYDKYLKYFYYGRGPDSRKEDVSEFTFRKTEVMLTLGRGITPFVVVEGGYVFKDVEYLKIEEDSPFSGLLKGVGHKFSPFVFFVLRFDTSDSQIHPKEGFRFLLQNDFAAGFLGNKNAEFHRMTLDFRKYLCLLGKSDVLAFRTLIQKISGSKIPLFEMSVLGGASILNAMRGYKLNRFLDHGKFLVNIEYRFPLFWRIGGNLFVDGGSVWPSWGKIDLSRTALNAGWGLRYYLKNFIVRFDMGFSKEGTGIYFNFNHVF